MQAQQPTAVSVLCPPGRQGRVGPGLARAQAWVSVTTFDEGDQGFLNKDN